jgi:hypothetical protein
MHGTARHNGFAKSRTFLGGTDLALAPAMERRGGFLVIASSLAILLGGAPSRVLAQVSSSESSASTGLVAELFALFTFVLLAMAAHWSARRRRD